VGAHPQVRLGLGYVVGVRTDEVEALVAAREAGGPFASLGELASRAGAGRAALETLAWAGACDRLAGIGADGADRGDEAARRGARRAALWQLGIASPGERTPAGTQLSLPLDVPAPPPLRVLDPWESMVADYATTGLTLGPHPLAIVRPRLPAGTVSIRDLEGLGHRATVSLGGLVVARQRPGTAKGVVFLLVEDEFGTVNLVVPPDIYERHRLIVRSEPLILARGRLEKLPVAGGAINVLVQDVRALVAPDEDAADVVELAERRTAARAAAVAAAAGPDRATAGSAAAAADFRGVAPAVQSFASGRRR
jgi:error-prone DNA polymerase